MDSRTHLPMSCAHLFLSASDTLGSVKKAVTFLMYQPWVRTDNAPMAPAMWNEGGKVVLIRGVGGHCIHGLWEKRGSSCASLWNSSPRVGSSVCP